MTLSVTEISLTCMCYHVGIANFQFECVEVYFPIGHHQTKVLPLKYLILPWTSISFQYGVANIKHVNDIAFNVFNLDESCNIKPIDSMKNP